MDLPTCSAAPRSSHATAPTSSPSSSWLMYSTHLVNLVPAGSMDIELNQCNMLDQDDGGALVTQWKHGGAGDWKEQLRQ